MNAEQVDVTKGISMTSACMECCPDSWYAFWIAPGSAVGIPGDTGQFTAMQQNQTCYGDILDPYQRFPNNFTSSDPSVASCDSTGFATALDGGTTNIGASWTVLFWDSDFDGLCHRYLERAHPSSNCYVQKPVSLSENNGPLEMISGGAVTDCYGRVITPAPFYGNVRRIVYTVLDQNFMPIRKTLSVHEDVVLTGANPPNPRNGNVNETISSFPDGTFCDVLSFGFGNRPPINGEFAYQKQFITVLTPAVNYIVRINCIYKTYNQAITSNITYDPTFSCAP